MAAKEHGGETTPANRFEPGEEAAGRPPSVPNHTLLSLIARGSYGEVWLARNELGQMRAVKLVYRSRFANSKPYEREFAGIKRFEPISREHEGFVDILQVGINEAEGFFFYVMELADPASSSGQYSVISKISDRSPAPPPNSDLRSANPDPPVYAATTLHSEIHRLGRFPFDRTVAVGIRLTEALAFLHGRGLVHRDIKPSNIIFVNGQPKLADVGLVADLGDPRSFVGTEGYIPPEGPGTAQADLYSLGMVLYEAATGKDRHDFPQVGSAIEALGAVHEGEIPANAQDDAPEDPGRTLVELNEVLLKCCARSTKHRYQSAAAMLRDLRRLEAGTSLIRQRQHRSRLRTVALVAGLALATASLTFLTHGLVKRAASTPHLMWVDEFDGVQLDPSRWSSNVVALQSNGKGKRTGKIVVAGGEAVLSAHSDHEKGSSAGLVVWMDSQIDWRTAGRCRVEISLAGAVGLGSLALSVSDGRSPLTYSELGGAEVLALHNPDKHEAVLPARTVWLDFLPEQQAAIFRPLTNQPDTFEVIDLRHESKWRLRFSCTASTAEGLPPGRATLTVKHVRAWPQTRSHMIVGHVLEALSEKPIPSAILSTDGGRTRFSSQRDGSFAIPLTQYDGGLQVEKDEYASWETTDRDTSTAFRVVLKKLTEANGDVVAIFPCPSERTTGIGVMDGTLMTLEVQDANYSRLMPLLAPDSAALTQVFDISLSSFMGVGSHRIGLVNFDGTNGGRILDLSKQHPETIGFMSNRVDEILMPLLWPRGCVLDGSLVWFLERDFIKDRHALRAFDLERGVMAQSVYSDDRQMLSLASDGKRFWISNEAGKVYEVDRDVAVFHGSLAGGQGRWFEGLYSSLVFHDGFLWGFNPKRRVFCKIKVTD